MNNAVDIFCGNHHSFYKDSNGSIFAWGLNTYGQLGTGSTKIDNCKPEIIKEFENLDILQIAGGEHHSIACTKDGRVFCWGRNDEG